MKTVNLELSKKLKEAGFPQETAFYYDAYHLGQTGKDGEKIELVAFKQIENEHFQCFASPTADEILDLLPWKLNFIKDLEHYLTIVHAFDDDWDLRYRTFASYGDQEITDFEMKHFQGGGMRPVTNGQPFWSNGESLADAAAQMWLYLKKSDLLKGKIETLRVAKPFSPPGDLVRKVR